MYGTTYYKSNVVHTEMCIFYTKFWNCLSNGSILKLSVLISHIFFGTNRKFRLNILVNVERKSTVVFVYFVNILLIFKFNDISKNTMGIYSFYSGVNIVLLPFKIKLSI